MIQGNNMMIDKLNEHILCKIIVDFQLRKTLFRNSFEPNHLVLKLKIGNLSNSDFNT